MAHGADPDQLASWEANCSGSTLFAKAGYIRVQQDKGWSVRIFIITRIGVQKDVFSVKIDMPK